MAVTEVSNLQTILMNRYPWRVLLNSKPSLNSSRSEPIPVNQDAATADYSGVRPFGVFKVTMEVREHVEVHASCCSCSEETGSRKGR